MSKKDTKKKAPAKKAEAKADKKITVDGSTFELLPFFDTGRFYWKGPKTWIGTYATEEEALKSKPS